MLTEYDTVTRHLISATYVKPIEEYFTQVQLENIASLQFVELRKGSSACYVLDASIATEIWDAHISGKSVVLELDSNGSFTGAKLGLAVDFPVENDA